MMADAGTVMMPRPYTQTFPNHGCQILDQLNVQRYYGNFCDVIVRVQDADFKVHKCVLAASSSKLQALMYGMQQDNTDVLSLKDLTLNGFKSVVEYMYTGILRLDASSVQEVLVSSQYLELRDVEKACLEFYKSTGAEAPLPPLEAALGLVRMSALCTSGLPYPPISSSSSSLTLAHSSGGGSNHMEPVMVILPSNHGNHGNSSSSSSSSRNEHYPRSSAVSLPAASSPPPPPPPPPQPTAPPMAPMPPVVVSHNAATVSSSVVSNQPMNPQIPGYIGPNPGMAIDTNYIEDYLKIIESIQGEQNPPQLEPQVDVHTQQVATVATQQEPPQLVAANKPSSSTVATQSLPPDPRLPQNHVPLQQQQQQQQHQDTGNQGVTASTPPVAVVNPRPTTTTSFSVQPTTSTTGMYSAEEVRRTILSVLSQEKFDDDDDDDSEKEKEPLPLTSLLNIQPLQKKDSNRTQSRSEVLPPIPDDNIDDVPLDMHMRGMDGSSDSEPEAISEISSDRDELHIHIPDTPEDVSPMTLPVPCLPLAPAPAPPPPPLLHLHNTDHIEQQCNSPEPKTGGPLILRIKRKQRKGLAFDFGDFETMSSTPVASAPVQQVSDLPWKREVADPTSDWSGGAAGSSTSMDAVVNVGAMQHVQVDRSGQYMHTIAPSSYAPQLPHPYNTYAAPITDGDKSYVQMKPPEPLSFMSSITNPQPPVSDTIDRVSTCPKPFKKRLPNRSKPVLRKPSLSCEKCGREFDKVDSLQKHMELHETDTNNIVYSCHVCGFKYNRPGELTRHMRKHSSDSFQCHLCAVEFREPRLFRRHMQAMHNIDKPFTCSYPGCNFSADKLSHVEKHRTIHSGVKAFECPKCNKGFSQINGLRSHLKSCFQRRGYECRTCGQKFNHLQSLKSHVLLHSGEKPHICEDCGAKFADNRNFKRHRRIHENTYPYCCKVCKKKFRHSNSLKAHCSVHQKHNIGGCEEGRDEQPRQQYEDHADHGDSEMEQARTHYAESEVAQQARPDYSDGQVVPRPASANYAGSVSMEQGRTNFAEPGEVDHARMNYMVLGKQETSGATTDGLVSVPHNHDHGQEDAQPNL